MNFVDNLVSRRVEQSSGRSLSTAPVSSRCPQAKSVLCRGLKSEREGGIPKEEREILVRPGARETIDGDGGTVPRGTPQGTAELPQGLSSVN